MLLYGRKNILIMALQINGESVDSVVIAFSYGNPFSPRFHPRTPTGFKFINAEGVASNPPPPDPTANHAKYAKRKTGFPFAYLADFAVHSASTPSE